VACLDTVTLAMHNRADYAQLGCGWAGAGGVAHKKEDECGDAWMKGYKHAQPNREGEWLTWRPPELVVKCAAVCKYG
jgi:hypothetical protein